MSDQTLYLSAVVIVILAILIYKWYYSSVKVINPSNVLLFYRDGCPFCEIFKPEWARVEHYLKEKAKKFNTANPKNASLASQYKVSGVPSIILVDPSGAYETYLGSRDADSIIARMA